MSRSRFVIELSGMPREPAIGEDFRHPSESDLEALAHLMLEAYRDTIDYDGEDLDDARAEISSYFEGEPVLEHSFVAEVGGDLASAVLVSTFEGSPFISYVMTLPEHKNQGWGRRLVEVAMASLANAGEREVVFYITDGNLPSEAVFRSLGARRVEG